jgi:hypothetical protein
MAPFSQRQNVLTPTFVAQYRAAISAMSSTYSSISAIHRKYCHVSYDDSLNGTTGYTDELFLHWHRAYVRHFELQLPAATLDAVPYIDWMDTNWSKINIPGLTSYGFLPYEFSYFPSNANPNPHARRYNWMNKINDFYKSCNYSDYLSKILNIPNFCRFSIALESFHDAIHAIIGGDMGIAGRGNNRGASDDPIFWLHHCFIDYHWARWQANFKSPNQQINYSSPSFSQFSTLLSNNSNIIYDINALGYTYSIIPNLKQKILKKSCKYNDEVKLRNDKNSFKVDKDGNCTIDQKIFNDFIGKIVKFAKTENQEEIFMRKSVYSNFSCPSINREKKKIYIRLKPYVFISPHLIDSH